MNSSLKVAWAWGLCRTAALQQNLRIAFRFDGISIHSHERYYYTGPFQSHVLFRGIYHRISLVWFSYDNPIFPYSPRGKNKRFTSIETIIIITSICICLFKGDRARSQIVSLIQRSATELASEMTLLLILESIWLRLPPTCTKNSIFNSHYPDILTAQLLSNNYGFCPTSWSDLCSDWTTTLSFYIRGQALWL